MKRRLYRVLLWTGGKPGRGQSVPHLREATSGRQAASMALRTARRLLPRIEWAASPHHAQWIRPKPNRRA